jgi:hypothetical protein
MLFVIEGGHGRSMIGVSINPSTRLAQLRVASALPLSFAAIYAPDCDLPGAMRIEQGADEILAGHRTEGEWFDVEPEVAAAAMTVSAMRCGIKLSQVDPAQADTIAKVIALPESADHQEARRRAERFLFGVACLFALFALLAVFYA